MVAALGTYRRLLGAQLRGQAQYRASFVVQLVGTGLFTVGDLVGVVVIFRAAPRIAGFAFAEALLIAALAALSFALAEVFVGRIERLQLYVRTGLFDALLVRPRSTLAQLAVMDFAPRQLARVLVGAATLALAAGVAPIEWSASRAVLLVVAPLAGGALFSAIFVASATVAFWWTDSGDLGHALTYGGRDFTSYPVPVYGALFRRVFAYGLGLGFVAYHPALALLGRADPLGGPAWLGWASPLVAVGAVALAALAWRTGVRHYRSTGS
jgi:ABC-2 type transport system permease protein